MAGTTEDEQAKQSINEMFGDDDSDSDADDQMRPVSTATTADASGLFGSDSESEEDDDESKRTVAPSSAAKKRRAAPSSASSKAPRRGRPNESARSNARTNSGDEYESDDDVVRTKDDDDFIDQEDDLADVLDEYNQDTQKFEDERPLPELERPTKKQEVDYFEETLQSLKTGRRGKLRLSVQEQEQLVQEVLYRMDKAQADDSQSITDHKPALEKIKFVDQAIYMLRKQQLQPLFLDFDLLSFIKKWLDPLDDGSLPNLGVRTKMLNMVAHLPVMKEHLKRSGFGKVVMTLWKHPDETPENKEVCRDLIERWSRAVFDKTLDYAKLGELEAEKAESMGYRRPEHRPSPKEPAVARSDANADPFMGYQPPEHKDTHERALLPSELRFDFVHRPQPKIEMQSVVQSKPPPALDSRKTRLVKKMQEIARPGRKGKRSVSMKVDGR